MYVHVVSIGYGVAFRIKLKDRHRQSRPSFVHYGTQTARDILYLGLRFVTLGRYLRLEVYSSASGRRHTLYDTFAERPASVRGSPFVRVAFGGHALINHDFTTSFSLFKLYLGNYIPSIDISLSLKPSPSIITSKFRSASKYLPVPYHHFYHMTSHHSQSLNSLLLIQVLFPKTYPRAAGTLPSALND